MFLREHGAESVIVADIEYVFTRDNPLFAKLAAAVGA
jgi:ATP phosphoribosyltransferase